jgi:hypothetical protein
MIETSAKALAARSISAQRMTQPRFQDVIIPRPSGCRSLTTLPSAEQPHDADRGSLGRLSPPLTDVGVSARGPGAGAALRTLPESVDG